MGFLLKLFWFVNFIWDPCHDGSNGGCDQICNNNGGTAVCTCMTGYDLKSDGKTCHGTNLNFC